MPFTEKQVRNSVEKKVSHSLRGNGTSHWINIIHDDKKVGQFKLPGTHNKYLSPKAHKKNAKNLYLSIEQYNELIECNMTSKQYAEHLAESIKASDAT